jgi:predicted Zn-dependent protease
MNWGSMFPGSSLYTAPLGRVRFSRGFETRKPTRPGLPYVEKAGYRPASWVDLFEKSGPLEKERRGTRVLFTHPMTDTRIPAWVWQIAFPALRAVRFGAACTFA